MVEFWVQRHGWGILVSSHVYTMKMADIDIDHLENRLKEVWVERLYQKLSKTMGQTPEAFHFDDFKIKEGKLYNKGKTLTDKQNKLRSIGFLAGILGREGLRDLGFDIPRGTVMAQQAIMLNKMEDELPSASDIGKVDDTELQECTKNAARITKNLIEQLNGLDDLPMHKLIGLDKQLRSISCSLKWRWQRRFSYSNSSTEKSISLKKFETIQSTTMEFEKTSGSELPS